jgi:hypothetical protein
MRLSARLVGLGSGARGRLIAEVTARAAERRLATGPTAAPHAAPPFMAGVGPSPLTSALPLPVPTLGTVRDV